MKDQQGRDEKVATEVAAVEATAEVVAAMVVAVDMVDATEETMVEIDVQAEEVVITVAITDPTMRKDDQAGTEVMEAVTEDTTDELAPRNESLKVSKQNYAKRSMVLIINLLSTLNFFKHKLCKEQVGILNLSFLFLLDFKFQKKTWISTF